MLLRPLARGVAWGGLLVSLSACGSSNMTGTTPTDAAVFFDAPSADVAAASDVALPPCSIGGAGRLRVGVSLDPDLERRTPEVWLSVHCGADLRPVRVVRWDRSGSQLLDGFGAGRYQVYASSFLAAGSWSAPVTLEGVSTVAVPVTLGASPASLVTLTTDDVVTGADAGVRDAGTALPTWGGRSTFRAGADSTVGVLEVEFQTVTPTTDAGVGTVSMRAVVRNVCSSAMCPTLQLHSVEVRSLRADAPAGVSLARFEMTAALAVGQSASLPQPVTLPGSLPDAAQRYQVALYGTVPVMNAARGP